MSRDVDGAIGSWRTWSIAMHQQRRRQLTFTNHPSQRVSSNNFELFTPQFLSQGLIRRGEL